MLNKALDLLRTLGWAIINFIYSLIDSLFDILKEINALDIVNSISNESMFRRLYTGIFAISVTVLALFSIYNFIKKIIDPDEGLSMEQIIKDIIKCGFLMILSTFIFVQASNLSINLSGYTASVFSSKDTTLANNMLIEYISYTDAYKESDEFKNENISKYIKNDNFTKKKMYNDKFITNSRWILPDEEEYKYSINWIMSIIVGGFFLYALFFSGMMLARRQIEFLFLFVISPIIFATSVGDKSRRNALFQHLVSLILQGAVIMLIIGLTALLMKSVQNTTFFSNAPIKDMVIKSILYIGCATFLLTGSQVINRFVGGNVAVNSGREQLMSMSHFGNAVRTGAVAGGLASIGAGLVGAGTLTSGAGNLGGNKMFSSAGKTISSFGKKISENSKVGSARSNLGNAISKFGTGIQNKTPSSIGKSLRTSGYRNVGDAISTMDPTKNIYRRRYLRRK